MGDLREQHEALLAEWEAEYDRRGEKFIRDGFADEDMWLAAHRRILWILREPNDTSGRSNVWRLDDFLRVPPWIPGGLQPSRRHIWDEIGRCTYGLAQRATFGNAHAEYAESSVLRSAAAINLKKRPGTERVHWPTLKDTVRRDADLLRRQIILLDPHLIVSGGVMELLCATVLAIGYTKDDMHRWWGKRLIVEAGHPAHRGSCQAYYEGLMVVHDSASASVAEP